MTKNKKVEDLKRRFNSEKERWTWAMLVWLCVFEALSFWALFSKWMTFAVLIINGVLIAILGKLNYDAKERAEVCRNG